VSVVLTGLLSGSFSCLLFLPPLVLTRPLPSAWRVLSPLGRAVDPADVSAISPFRHFAGRPIWMKHPGDGGIRSRLCASERDTANYGDYTRVMERNAGKETRVSTEPRAPLERLSILKSIREKCSSEGSLRRGTRSPAFCKSCARARARPSQRPQLLTSKLAGATRRTD